MTPSRDRVSGAAGRLRLLLAATLVLAAGAATWAIARTTGHRHDPPPAARATADHNRPATTARAAPPRPLGVG
ncbi:MAG TPA: hypothetical protein VE127_03145, partial [Solirubrobacteraceae bacterium]|nr:hypothetical protein [Solirubrobacteraceae bacterium]